MSPKWQNVSPPIAKEDRGKTIRISNLSSNKKLFSRPLLLTSRNAKSGCVIRVVKRLKGDWFIQMH